MMDKREFYIDGAWVAPRAGSDFAVIDPSNEEAFATISLGGQADTDAAVAAAKAAFPKWRLSSKAERLELMQEILDVYMKRSDDMGAVISQEMGAPIDMAKVQQSGTGSFHIKAFIEALNEPDFTKSSAGFGNGLYDDFETVRAVSTVGHAVQRDHA